MVIGSETGAHPAEDPKELTLTGCRARGCERAPAWRQAAPRRAVAKSHSVKLGPKAEARPAPSEDLLSMSEKEGKGK